MLLGDTVGTAVGNKDGEAVMIGVGIKLDDGATDGPEGVCVGLFDVEGTTEGFAVIGCCVGCRDCKTIDNFRTLLLEESATKMFPVARSGHNPHGWLNDALTAATSFPLYEVDPVPAMAVTYPEAFVLNII